MADFDCSDARRIRAFVEEFAAAYLAAEPRAQDLLVRAWRYASGCRSRHRKAWWSRVTAITVNLGTDQKGSLDALEAELARRERATRHIDRARARRDRPTLPQAALLGARFTVRAEPYGRVRGCLTTVFWRGVVRLGGAPHWRSPLCATRNEATLRAGDMAARLREARSFSQLRS